MVYICFMSLNISFYLLNPEAKKTSAIYVSISDGNNRERFSTGENIPIMMVNKQRKKGKPLLKRSSELYMFYSERLKQFETKIRSIYMEESSNSNQTTLQIVKDKFQLSNGKGASGSNGILITAALSKFVSSNLANWSTATVKIYKTLSDHLDYFDKNCVIDNFNHVRFSEFRNYLTETGLANSSTNKYLKSLKTFMKWCLYPENNLIKIPVSFDQMESLKKGEAFKVALKEDELESLIGLKLDQHPKLEKVRDLFVAQCLTGQRISDIHKVIDQKNLQANTIVIHQQKNRESVSIPIHPRLRIHLEKLFIKYPDGFPSITDQKVNDYLKELFLEYKFNREIRRVQRKGNLDTVEIRPMNEVISSHDGRRTFCTLARARGIDDLTIMKVSGHKNLEQFLEYIKIDDSDIDNAFNKLF